MKLLLNSHRAANVARYKILPSDWKTKDHYYFYSWAVTKKNSAKISFQYYRQSASLLWLSVQQFSKYMQRDVGFPHINYVAGKVDDEAAVSCRVEQTKEGPMLSLMSIGCRGYFGVGQRPCSWSDLWSLNFWGGATVVRGVLLYEGGIWIRTDALGWLGFIRRYTRTHPPRGMV
jgi:hypothetical protein